MTDSKASLLDSELLTESAQPEQVADAYADRLMDELFDGVERALQGDVAALDERPAPPAIAPPPAAAEMTLSFTEGGLPAVLFDGSADSELATLAASLAPSPIADTAPAPVTPGQKWKQFWTLNRALLGAAGVTLLATLGLWLHQRQQTVVTSSAPALSDAPTITAETEFLEYLRRSLDVIAQNAASAPAATTAVPDGAIALNLPAVANNVLPPSAVNGLPATPGSINVIERVYVPYPAAPGASYPTVPGAAAPAAPVPNGSPIAAAPVTTQTLLGVLELGDRSAALFSLDGTPQRVYIGERIGNSGWSLVSVANEEAVVRRNGEVRTLYIGQQF